MNWKTMKQIEILCELDGVFNAEIGLTSKVGVYQLWCASTEDCIKVFINNIDLGYVIEVCDCYMDMVSHAFKMWGYEGVVDVNEIEEVFNEITEGQVNIFQPEYMNMTMGELVKRIHFKGITLGEHAVLFAIVQFALMHDKHNDEIKDDEEIKKEIKDLIERVGRDKFVDIITNID